MTSMAETVNEGDGVRSGRGFAARAPLPELAQRWLAFASLVLLGILAVVFGFLFKHNFDLYERGDPPIPGVFRGQVIDHLVYGQVALVVAMAALAIWSGVVVANARRVFYSLRSVPAAVGGWLFVPLVAFAAHESLDRALKSGWIITIAASLLFMYVPHGTIGGTARDLGGSSYLARVWYVLALLAALLMWGALAGTSSGLPSSDPQMAMRLKAYLCFVAGLLLFAAAATFFATAQNLAALTHHKWADALAPRSASRIPIGSVEVTRSAEFVSKEPLPTHALRVVVWCGLFVFNTAAVAATFDLRRRAIHVETHDGSVAAHSLLASATQMFNRIVVLGIATHVMYVVWAMAAATNARRRTLLAPSARVTALSFVGGAALFPFVSRDHDTFAAAMMVGAIGVVCIGFVVGQLLLGRASVALGGSGRIFLMWLIAEFGLCSTMAYVSRVARVDAELLTIGGLLAGFAVLSSVLGWLAMDRLDKRCGTDSGAVVSPIHFAMSRSLTSSQS
jgi:hypothetical protein